jgi:hypothetical protein
MLYRFRQLFADALRGAGGYTATTGTGEPARDIRGRVLKPHRAAVSLTGRPDQHRAARSAQLDPGFLSDGRGEPENRRDDLDCVRRALTVVPTDSLRGRSGQAAVRARDFLGARSRHVAKADRSHAERCLCDGLAERRDVPGSDQPASPRRGCGSGSTGRGSKPPARAPGLARGRGGHVRPGARPCNSVVRA